MSISDTHTDNENDTHNDDFNQFGDLQIPSEFFNNTNSTYLVHEKESDTGKKIQIQKKIQIHWKILLHLMY